MQDADRTKLLGLIQSSTKEFVDTVESLSEEQAAAKPGGSWSALEFAEHLILAEEAMISWVNAGAPDATRPDADPDRDERVIAGSKGRARRVQAPEGSVPKGRFATKAEAIDAFRARRAATMEWVGGLTDNPRKQHTTHAVLGLIPCWTCLLVLAAHPGRHAAQVRENFA